MVLNRDMLLEHTVPAQPHSNAGKTGQPTVVVSAANALAEEKQRCLESGMDSCLSKPVTLDVLKQTLTVYAARVRNGRE